MDLPNRKSLRLKYYDYTKAGGYFITLCTHNHKWILSSVTPSTDGRRPQIILTELGRIAQSTLLEISTKQGIHIDSYVVMPNHIHMIVFIMDNPNSTSTGRFIGAFKSLVAKHWRDACNARGTTAGKLWQRNYYDHVLRNHQDYVEKLKYIDENPDKWHLDDLCMQGR